MPLTKTERNQLCIVPGDKIRWKIFHCSVGEMPKKLQQIFYNYDGTAFVWRDVNFTHVALDDFNATVNYE